MKKCFAVASIAIMILICMILPSCTPKVDEGLPVPIGLDYDNDTRSIVWSAPDGAQADDTYIVKSNGKTVAKTDKTTIAADKLPYDVNEVTVSLLRDDMQSKDSEAFIYVSEGSSNVSYEVNGDKVKASFSAVDFPEDYSEDVIVQSQYTGLLVNEIDIYIKAGKIVIPDSVEIIDLYIAEPVKDMTLPKNLQEIEYIDVSCEAFDISEENGNFCAEDGILYSKDMKRLTEFPQLKQTERYDMPDSVEIIDCMGILSENAAIERITLSKNLAMSSDSAAYIICGFKEVIIPAAIDIGFCVTDAEKIIIEEGATTFASVLCVLSSKYYKDHTLVLPSTLQTLKSSSLDRGQNFAGYPLLAPESTFTIIAENNEHISSWHQNWQEGFTIVTEGN